MSTDEDFPSYPEIPGISQLAPGPQALLGRPIHWTEKRDGSNLRLAWRDGELRVGSRHLEAASNEFVAAFHTCPRSVELIRFLQETSGDSPVSFAADFCFNPVVYVELLVKGKSPTRIETHEQHEFVVFDIWDSIARRFMPYTATYQDCVHYQLPVVECWALTQHSTLEGLYLWRDKMLDMAKEKGREGVVLKAFDGTHHIYAKEKNDIPKIKLVSLDMGKPQLPSLPDSEVMGAINKAHVDLGEAFRDKAKAMPLIAQYVAEEQRKHLCSKPIRPLFTAYQEYLTQAILANGV